jgi:Cu+-exporting ATPase
MNNNVELNATPSNTRGCCCSKPSPAEVDLSPSTDNDTSVYQLAVKGAHCGGCKASIEQALSAVTGVTAATMDLENGIASVSGSVASNSLVETLETAGYSATIIG